VLVRAFRSHRSLAFLSLGDGSLCSEHQGLGSFSICTGLSLCHGALLIGPLAGLGEGLLRRRDACCLGCLHPLLALFLQRLLSGLSLLCSGFLCCQPGVSLFHG
jgi:hypothetical protein